MNLTQSHGKHMMMHMLIVKSLQQDCGESVWYHLKGVSRDQIKTPHPEDSVKVLLSPDSRKFQWEHPEL